MDTTTFDGCAYSNYMKKENIKYGEDCADHRFRL
jgi:hypothetical protein